MANLTRRKALTAAGTTAATAIAGCLAGGSSQNLVELEEWPPSRQADELEFWTWQRYWGDQALAFKHSEDLEELDRIVVPAYQQIERLRDGESPDVVHILSRQFSNAMEEDLLQPLPTDVMPAWPPDNELRTQDLSFYERDGQYYGYPQTPVAMGLAFHHDVMDEATSWSVLWDEEYAGRIAMPADPVLLGQIGALYTGQDPFDPEDPDAIREALLEQEPLVDEYWEFWLHAWRKFGRDGLDAGVLPHPQMCLCSQDYTPVKYGHPEALVYAQSTLAIPADTENPYLAAEFTNYAGTLKVGTEMGWNADEWNLLGDRPVSDTALDSYRSIAEELDTEEA